MLLKLSFLIAYSFIICSINLFGQDKISRLNEILTLEGSELIDNLEEYHYSDYYKNITQKNVTNYKNIDTLKLFWNVLDKIINLQPKSYDEKFTISYFLPDLLNDILSNNADDNYKKLEILYKSFPDTSYLRDEAFLVPMYQYKVCKEIENAISKKLKPIAYTVLPENLKLQFSTGPQNRTLFESKELFNSIQKYYNQRILNDTSCGWYSFQSNLPLFYKTIENILFNPTSEDLKKLHRFQWGGWCGTGSEFFYSKKTLVELLILLRERDYFSILGRREHYSSTNLYEKTKVKLLELCNVDWIDYYTGAILTGKQYDIPSIFTKYGSDKAALNLLKLKDSITNQSRYIQKCAEFLNPFPKNEMEQINSFDNNDLLHNFELSLPFQIIPINNEIKLKLKNEIINISLNADEFELCQSAIIALDELEFDEKVKEVFLVLSNSKYPIVRNNAAEILKKKGVLVNLPVDDGKIKFKFLVDGIPFKQELIKWEVINNDSKLYNPFLIGSEYTTKEGILHIAKDKFLDHLNNISKIIFYPDIINYNGNEILFYCESKIANKLSDTLIINIATTKISLNFHLNRDRNFYKNKKMEIYASGPKLLSIDFKTDVTEKFKFPVGFQKGIQWYFSSYVPGALDWFVFFQDSIKSDSTFNIYLENGTNVVLNIIPPGGSKSDNDVLFELKKVDSLSYDFFHYDYSINGYENVPIGEYKLIISSSAEKKSVLKKNKNECSEIISSDYPDYEGKIISFSIKKNSPAVIDLGIIKLDAVGN